MSHKRSHSEYASDVHPSRLAHIPPTKPPIATAPRKLPSNAAQKEQAHDWSVNAIKKKIRSCTRILSRADDLPADVRDEQERALSAYTADLATAEASKRQQEMIKRYHMVRFFERQKATRRLKRFRKQLVAAETEEEVQRLTKLLHIADVDVAYAMYAPLGSIYVSIYPKREGRDEVDEDSLNPARPDVWYEVEKRMDDKRALDALRNTLDVTSEDGQGGMARARKKEVKPSSANAMPAESGRQSRRNIERGTQASAPLPPGRVPARKLRISEDEFYRLNRRQKRAELAKVGQLTTKVPVRPRAEEHDVAEEAEPDEGYEDGGFFEE